MIDEKILKILEQVNLQYDENNLILSPSYFGTKRLPYHMIYIHINKINGKYYIGQTCNPYERWGRKGSKYKEDPRFWPAIQKYGWDNFYHYILETSLSQQEANEKEKYYIDFLKARTEGIGYNLAPGGGNFGVELWNDPEYRKKASESFREARKKTWSNPEMASYLQGQLQKGVQRFWNDPEKRKKRIENIMGDKNPNSKAVVNIETGLIFTTITEASKWAGLKSLSCIGANCVGRTKSAGIHPETGERLHWRYAIEGVDYIQ